MAAAAVTFGSIGDIIAVCQLAVQLGRALSDAAGSAKRCQELRADLNTFANILMQVVATYEQRDFSPYMNQLDVATKEVVDDCAVLIQEVLDRLQARYGSSLAPSGTGSKMKDTYKKTEFCFAEKERLAAVQEKLRKNTERLTLLIGLTIRRSARVDNATMLARIKQVKKSVEESCSEQQRTGEELLRLHNQHESLLEKQNNRLTVIDGHLERQGAVSWTMIGTVTNTLNAIVAVGKKLEQVAEGVQQLQALVSISTILRNPDEQRISFEDAWGNILEIPFEWLHTWEAFDELLKHHSEDRTGYEMVEQGSYLLTDSCTGRSIDKDRPFPWSLHRGMKIDMTIIFFDIRIDGERRTMTQALSDISNCDCKSWARIVIKMEEAIFEGQFPTLIEDCELYTSDSDGPGLDYALRLTRCLKSSKSQIHPTFLL